MEWYWIILITVAAVHLVNLIIYHIFEDDGVAFMCATIWFPLYVLIYPYRAHTKYKKSYKYYESHGVSYWKYMFCKRVKSD